MRRVRSPADGALIAREIEVLQLAARGLSNNQIAKELFGSAITAKAHLVHIYAKLGVNDRTAAVTTALEHLARDKQAAHSGRKLPGHKQVSPLRRPHALNASSGRHRRPIAE